MIDAHWAGRNDGADDPGASQQAIHASALAVGEAGLLIRGPSGSGKSALTLALLAMAGARGQFAMLIGDDRIAIRRENERILATGAPRVQGLIERRGYGIVETPTEPCVVVRVIVDLLPQHERSARLPDAAELVTTLAGVALPRLIFGGESGPLERACALLGRLDNTGDKIMTAVAHFA